MRIFQFQQFYRNALQPLTKGLLRDVPRQNIKSKQPTKMNIGLELDFSLSPKFLTVWRNTITGNSHEKQANGATDPRYSEPNCRRQTTKRNMKASALHLCKKAGESKKPTYETTKNKRRTRCLGRAAEIEVNGVVWAATTTSIASPVHSVCSISSICRPPCIRIKKGLHPPKLLQSADSLAREKEHSARNETKVNLPLRINTGSQKHAISPLMPIVLPSLFPPS